MSEARTCVIAELDEGPALLFFSDEDAARWAMRRTDSPRLREAKVKFGADLVLEPPGPPQLRVAPSQAAQDALSVNQ